MIKRIFKTKFIYIFPILMGILWALSMSWQSPTSRCMEPFVSTVPAPMPNTISGLRARLESYRFRSRSMPDWWKRDRGFRHPEQVYSYSAQKIVLDGDDVWTVSYSTPAIQRYNTITGEQTVYHTVDGKEIKWVRHLLITRDGYLWIFVKIDASYQLALFDRGTNAFEPIVGNFPWSTWNGVRPPRWEASPIEVINGDLAIAFDKNIYLYDPRQNIAQPLLPNDFNFVIESLAVSGSRLWFIAAGTKELWSLDISTRKATNYGGTPKEQFGLITVDYSGKVWLGYFAYLEMNNEGKYEWMYPSSYPPEFISLVHPYEDSLSDNGEKEYRWASIFSSFVASDNSVWFLTDSGIVKYDPHHDTWCLSAPVRVHSMAEDKNGNLWMMPDDPEYQGLYKYELNP